MLQEEERRKIEFKDQLATTLKKLFPFNICQVVAVGPLLVSALDLLKQRYSQAIYQKHGGGLNVHHGLQENYLTGYRTDMLRFIRANYEIFLDHFRSQRVQNLVIQKYMKDL